MHSLLEQLAALHDRALILASRVDPTFSARWVSAGSASEESALRTEAVCTARLDRAVLWVLCKLERYKS